MLDRAAFIKTIEGKGWNHSLAFRADGPVVFIRGPWRYRIEMAVPVRLEDDHTPSLDGIYSLVAGLQHEYGIIGNA